MPLIDPPRQSGQESAHGAGRRRPAGRPPEAAALRYLEDAEILAARRHSMHEENLLPPTKRGERPSTQRVLDRPCELVLVAAEPPAFGHEGAGLGSTARGDLEEQPEALLVLLRLQDDVQGKGQPIDDHQRRRLTFAVLGPDRGGRRCEPLGPRPQLTKRHGAVVPTDRTSLPSGRCRGLARTRVDHLKRILFRSGASLDSQEIRSTPRTVGRLAARASLSARSSNGRNGDSVAVSQPSRVLATSSYRRGR